MIPCFSDTGWLEKKKGIMIYRGALSQPPTSFIQGANPFFSCRVQQDWADDKSYENVVVVEVLVIHLLI